MERRAVCGVLVSPVELVIAQRDRQRLAFLLRSQGHDVASSCS